MRISEIMKELRNNTRAGAHYVIRPLVDNKLIARKGSAVIICNACG